MANENWLFRTPPRAQGPRGAGSSASSKSPNLTLDEYVSAAASALASPKIAMGPTGLADATARFIQNVRQRAELNRQTYAQPMQVPKAPPGESIEANMREAAKHKGNLLWFYNQVKPKGPWDFKRHYGGGYEEFGNFHYGAVGRAADIPADFLRRGAGAAQVVSDFDGYRQDMEMRKPPHKTVDPFQYLNMLNYPYGDNNISSSKETPDQPKIDRGIRFGNEWDR